ncbi:hypothetical protein MKEN_00596600 [Mycena kentingensis (nom. inval.)]|nr:hypothetical protein MKEN_00596600 [Mycena kentingensis (nom. inval.)]
MSSITASYSDVALLLGPYVRSSLLRIVLTLNGVLSCQFVNYYSWYRDDKLHLRVIVTGLVVITWLKSIQAFATLWIEFVVYFGDIVGAYMAAISPKFWWDSGNALIAAAIGLYVQTYFVWRLYVVSKHWAPALFIELVCLFGFLFAAVVVCSGVLSLLPLLTNESLQIYYVNNGQLSAIGPWLAAHVAGSFGMFTDPEWAAQTEPASVAGFINALLRLTFQTAAPATICAFIYLVVSQIPISTGTPFFSPMVTVFNMPLPKLYAISMMWTLNARRTIRAGSTHHGMSATSNELSGARVRTQANGDVELSRIQVLTQTQTTQHIDQATSGGSSIYDDNWNGPPPVPASLKFQEDTQNAALAALVAALHLPDVENVGQDSPQESQTEFPAIPPEARKKFKSGGTIAGAIIGGLCAVGLVTAAVLILVGQGLIYGFAAVRAYAAYRDPIFLHYAITAWESANSLTLTQQMLDFGVIPPGKNFSAITTCQGSSMAGGTLQEGNTNAGVIDSSTTSLFGLISAYLAEATSNATYLSAASNSISFLRAQLFSNVTNLATQAISAQNCDTDTKLVVFNSAFMLELVAVFLSVSPNLNPELRNLLHDLFNAVTQSSLFISSSGAIKGGDMALPHAVFTAYSRNLTMGVQKQAAESFLSRQFDAVTLQASSGGSNIYSTNWDGPPPAENTTFSAHVQDPALVALVGSLYLPETAAAPSISKSAAAVDSGKTKPNVGGMIAGAVVGGLFVVGFFVAGAVIFTRRRRRLQEEENKSEVSPPPVNPYVFSTPPTVSSRSDAGRPSWVSPKRGRNNNVSVQRETVVSDSSVSTEEVVRQLYFRMNQVPMDGEAPPGYGSR